MSSDLPGEKPVRPPAASRDSEREARLARALRDNLRRRKAQSRARADGGEGGDADRAHENGCDNRD